MSLISTFPFSAFGEDTSAQFCAPQEPFAPNGIVVRMADHYFQTCDTWTDGAWRQFILRVNPNAVPGLLVSRSASSIRVIENIEGIDRLASKLWYLPISDQYTFGGVTYRSFGSETLGPNGRSNRIVFVYDSPENDLVPSHYVRCFGWGHVGYEERLNCNVEVDVGAVVGSKLFLGAFEMEQTFRDLFPSVAHYISLILELADVTDSLDQINEYTDIVE